VSSIRLSVRFNWRHFELALVAHIIIAEIPFTNFSLIRTGTGILPYVQCSSILLVVNMDETAGHMGYALAPFKQKKLLCYHVRSIPINFNNLLIFW